MDISRKCKSKMVKCLKQKIFDQFQQKRRSDIENSPKGLSYRLFKENFEFEHYLDILPDKDRITYCRFRTHSQKSWVILLMNIHKPNRVIYDVSK